MHCALNAQFPKTFLSPTLHCLLDMGRMKKKDNALYEGGPYVTSACTFIWENIEPLISNITGCQEPISCNQVSGSLWPILHQAGNQVRTCQSPPFHLCTWTNFSDYFLKCFEEINAEQDNIIPLKSVLLLSSIFERALGNVYLIHGKCVPFLLRDLLKAAELSKIFGSTPMRLAQLLLGTPYAFNIRNVCWHGFPAPYEIDMSIAASLMVLIFSFGEILVKTGVQKIHYRFLISASDWKQHLILLHSTRFPLLKDVYRDISSIIQSCHFIPITHKPYWLKALTYIETERNAEGLLLLLPALEHLLRCLFCEANMCPKQMLLAEQDTFYLTLDEILGSVINGLDGSKRENLIRTVFGDRLLEMLLDVFHYSAGPRIRDKISHGECDLHQVPCAVINHLLCICLLIFEKLPAYDISWFKHMGELKAAEDCYISKFHPASLLLRRIKFVMAKLQDLQICYQETGSVAGLLPEISDLQLVLVQLSPSRHVGDITRDIELLLEKKISLLYRSKSDMINISMLMNIVSLIEKAVLNCQLSLETRAKLLCHHKLRSRQRQLYYRMLNFIPSFYFTFKSIILILLVHLHSLPQILLCSRSANSVMKYCAKMASLSRTEKNNWEEMKNISVNISLQLHTVMSMHNEYKIA